jgi:hypothetical protein
VFTPTLVLLFYSFTLPLSPEKIYENAIEYDMEIKAMTDKNVVSYDNAVVVSNDGKTLQTHMRLLI